ncbi:hypothetical protein AURDEDRAFT_185581 [Auricularia subglabra TFB-10046 SS5]|nr:hypothetical protein AURDEDRAFT_185581 [Auricularia subglabra TFB-10046 SS5]
MLTESALAAMLPIELVLLVVDLAARSDPCTGAALALVCREIAKEAVPALYHTVLLRTWRSTRAFERLLSGEGASSSVYNGAHLACVRNLSGPFLQDESVPLLARRCPRLRSLQLLHPPAAPMAAEVFVLAPFSGVIRDSSAVPRMLFHSQASLWHDPPQTQPHPTRTLTHFCMAHNLDEPASGALATIRAILAYPCLQVMCVRLMQYVPPARFEDREMLEDKMKSSDIWKALDELHDPRVRAGLYLVHSVQTQRQMVDLWEDHIRETDDVWSFGEFVSSA